MLDKNTKHVAVGCFVGGILCAGVAYLCAPVYWFIGLFAGIAGGYLACDLRDVWKKIPIAWRLALVGICEGVDWFLAIWKFVVTWLKKPHPWAYPALPFSLTGTVLVSFFYHTAMLPREKGYLEAVSVCLIFMMSFIATQFLALVLIYLLAVFGAGLRHTYWQPFVFQGPDFCRGVYTSNWRYIERLEKDGWSEKQVTTARVLGWSSLGLLVGTVFLIGSPLIVLYVFVRYTLPLLGLFVWYLVRLIHSHKRVLCAVDGTLGGVISFLVFGRSELSSVGFLFMVVCGGLIGVALGVANWKYVSVRVFHFGMASSGDA